MPIAIIAGKPRRFHCQYGADSTVTHRRQKPAEARALVMAGSGDAQIVIDYHRFFESQFPTRSCNAY